MTMQTAGIHHITAFVGDAQRNADFYAGILGLRLVKKTINFDAPDVYHLYFGNEQGAPGTIITFFPWSTGRKGRIGGGQVGVTTYAVPAGSIGFWEQRLAAYQIPVTKVSRIGESYLSFADFDGLRIELVEREEGSLSTWSFAGVPVEHAIKGFGGAVLYSAAPDKTADTLSRTLGMERIAEGDGYIRYRAAGDIGNIIDLKSTPVPQGLAAQVPSTTSPGAPKMMPSNWNGAAAYRAMVTSRLRCRTASTSMPSTSVKKAESCSRLRPILPALPVMKHRTRWDRS